MHRTALFTLFHRHFVGKIFSIKLLLKFTNIQISLGEKTFGVVESRSRFGLTIELFIRQLTRESREHLLLLIGDTGIGGEVRQYLRCVQFQISEELLS